MSSILVNNVEYKKIYPLNVSRYNFLVVGKGDLLYFLEENNDGYIFSNLDLTLNGNANVPLSNLNSRILLNHIVEGLNKEEDKTEESILKKMFTIQKVLHSAEINNLIHGSVDQLYHFDESINELIEKYDELVNEITMTIELPKVKTKTYTTKHEEGNIDNFMIAMISNIGILLFIMFILSLIR